MMKPTESQIKQALLHPDPVVRDAALAYFALCFTQDHSIMPVAVQTIDKHGWEEAFEYDWLLQNLPQTDETLRWLLEQLEAASILSEDMRLRISSILYHADADLLAQHRSDVLACRQLDERACGIIRERLRLRSVRGDACWQELEDLCRRHKDAEDSRQFDFGQANRLVEAISREGDRHARRVLDILGQKVENFQSNPLACLEIFAAQLAGLLRIQAAAPLLAAKLKDDDGDFTNEECAYALTKIGGVAAAQAIAQDFHAAPDHFQLYASGALENMRGDNVVTTALELLRGKLDQDIRINLVSTALTNFDTRGLDAVKEFGLLDSPELRQPLIATATLTGAEFPEFAMLRQIEQEHRADRRRRQQWLLHGFRQAAKPKVEALFPEPVATPAKASQKIGRNEPCPCGSGKKYKKCCGSKH